MAGVITTGSAPKTLWPGIWAFWGQVYDEPSMEYKYLFEIKTSDKSYEETPEIIGFGLAPEKAEGTSVQYDTWRQGPVTRYTNQPFALGFQVTREELADNQYAEVVNRRVPQLAFSMRTTKETVLANIYNRGFNSSFVGGDGVELFSLVHPTDDGTQSNELTTAADLSEASLEDLLIQISNADNSRGLRLNLRGSLLIVPNSLVYVAERILGSEYQNDTANNAINAIKSIDGLTWRRNTYLTDTDAWFVRTNAPAGMCVFNREETEFSEDNDFDTDNMKYKAYMRFRGGWSDFRGNFGSPGA